MRDFGRWLAEQGVSSEKVTVEALEDDDLPDGLYMRLGKPHFDCWGCGRSCEWEVEIERYDANLCESNMGGCSERCVP